MSPLSALLQVLEQHCSAPPSAEQILVFPVSVFFSTKSSYVAIVFLWVFWKTLPNEQKSGLALRTHTHTHFAGRMLSSSSAHTHCSALCYGKALGFATRKNLLFSRDNPQVRLFLKMLVGMGRPLGDLQTWVWI